MVRELRLIVIAAAFVSVVAYIVAPLARSGVDAVRAINSALTHAGDASR